MAGEAGIDRTSPMFWGLFSAGGFVLAFLLPVFIVMNGIAYPFRLVPATEITYDGMHTWVGSLLVKLFLVLIVGSCLFHGLHRLKYVLIDAGLGSVKRALDPIVYGIAAAGTVAAVFLAFSF